MLHSNGSRAGFTLIELSIVLVIIGLIVGGVLVGQDLIRSSEIRATVTQIEKYNTAVNTFRGKYNNSIPGDINAASASQFNLTARGNFSGEGDGNGMLEGISANAAASNNGFLQSGETTMFWVDLSTTNGNNINLVDGSFNTAAPTTFPAITSAQMNQFYPAAKLGRGNYVYVYSTNGRNYFGIANLSSVAVGGVLTATTSMSVQQAYQIDKKMDDGFPGTGGVTAQYDTGGPAQNAIAPWVGATIVTAAPGIGTIVAATPASAATCYDNGNTANAQAIYTITQNNGNGANCALSFRFQ